MEPAAAGALYAAENLFSGAAALIKGITHPTLPLKANLTHIGSVSLPRSRHTLSVIKGRAYIWGGEIAAGNLADNDMHVIILPSSGVLEADYTAIKAHPDKAGGEIPGPRKGHTSVVIGDSIYIFGGEGVEEENGRIWIFRTSRNTWSYLDPATNTFPSHRAGHVSVASDFPAPKDITFQEKAPQQPADPAKVVPEPADEGTWGTIFVLGGCSVESGQLANDVMAFDVRSRTWSNIPIPHGPPTEGSSLALAGNILYRFGGKDSSSANLSATVATQCLDVSPVWKHAEGGTTPLNSGWSWDIIPSPSGADGSDLAAPTRRYLASVEGVTTGQGRHYLLVFGGCWPGPDNTTTFLDDIWAYQLPSERTSAAATKDSLRAGLRRDTHEAEWAEVEYKYTDTAGADLAFQEENTTKGFGARGGFAAAKGTEVDGASVVIWGGLDAEGNLLGDGWLITAER